MSDLYRLAVRETTTDAAQVVVTAVNHAGQEIPLDPLFYLSVLTDTYQIAVTGRGNSPALVYTHSVAALPAGCLPGHRHPLYDGVLDAHVETLEQIQSDADTLLQVTIEQTTRDRYNAAVGRVRLRSPSPGLFAHLTVGSVYSIVHGEEDSPLEELFSSDLLIHDGPPRDPRLNERLCLAAQSGDLAAARSALAAGANPDAGAPSSVLHRAAHTGQDALAALLLAAGANADVRGITGRTPLHTAINYGHTAVVRLLLGADARLDLRDEEGRVALHTAARADRQEILALLLGHGAPPDARSTDGRTPLHRAVTDDEPGPVAALLAAGADVDSADQYGFTPLMVAARHPQVVQLLLSHGADQSARNARGESARDIAVRIGADASALLLA